MVVSYSSAWCSFTDYDNQMNRLLAHSGTDEEHKVSEPAGFQLRL